MTTEARLRARTRVGAGLDPCWEWIGYRTAKGYGQMSVAGAVEYTHRIAWTLVNGPIPVGLEVLHSCDNPPCRNPAHLFLGTQGDNLADMHSKGRWPRRVHCRYGHVTPMRAMWRDGFRRCPECVAGKVRRDRECRVAQREAVAS